MLLPPLSRALAALSMLFPADAARRGQMPAPVQIEVVASDYAFSPLPAHIRRGATIFAFANHGKFRHEVSIARLRAGSSVEEVIKTLRDGGRQRDIIERSVGILIAGPGKSPDGRILVDLVPGATYVLVCNLKNTPDSPGHLMFGMYTSFRAE